jgi:exodeoxyribonuclease V alpha subunit
LGDGFVLYTNKYHGHDTATSSRITSSNDWFLGGCFNAPAVYLAYATTIHKSQGSEFHAVVIPVTAQHYMMLQRTLLYTGVTRGKQLGILVGQKKAVAIAIKNVSGRRRW